MCCCCGRKRQPRIVETPPRPAPQVSTLYLTNIRNSTSITNNSFSSMATKDDPVARSVGHLLGAEPAYFPPRAESRTSFTPPSTRSSISIPTSEIISNVFAQQTGATGNTTLPPPSINDPTTTPFTAFTASTSSPPAFETPFACLKIQLNDQLVANDFPNDAVHLIRRTLETTWPRGIQREEPIYRSGDTNANVGRNFKLRGNPFFNSPAIPTTLGETVPACRTMAALLNNLSRAGWVLTLVSGTAAGTRQYKPNLIFRFQDPAPAPQQWAVLTVIQVGSMDTLRIIDAPGELCKDLQVTLEKAGMTSRYGKSFEGVFDIELGKARNTPDNVDISEMMLVMLRVLDRHGFTVAASLDQAWDHGKPDTWYVCRSEGWSEGMPVFHR